MIEVYFHCIHCIQWNFQVVVIEAKFPQTEVWTNYHGLTHMGVLSCHLIRKKCPQPQIHSNDLFSEGLWDSMWALWHLLLHSYPQTSHLTVEEVMRFLSEWIWHLWLLIMSLKPLWPLVFTVNRSGLSDPSGQFLQPPSMLTRSVSSHKDMVLFQYIMVLTTTTPSQHGKEDKPLLILKINQTIG